VYGKIIFKQILNDCKDITGLSWLMVGSFVRL